MSSDTAKENASVVDSSVTEWKHEMGNSDDLESPEYKDKYEEFPSQADKGSYNQQVKSNASTKGRQGNTRYFIIKSLNHQNIQLSIEKGIWATQVMNEPILEEAFHNSGKVILIFSVNMSGFFQGYAQMMSSVGWRRDNVWTQGSSKNNPWGRSFKVKWLRLNDLPFQKTLHLKNPLNDFKPVKISRDCQELPEDIGEALCGLIDGETNTDDSVVKRFTKDVVSQRPYVEHPCSIGDVEYNNVSALHMPWASTPMSYNPFFYQHHAEAGTNRNFNSLQVDVPGRLDAWGLSADSPLASTLTDDDFLEMTYEEYLEVHSRSMKSMNGRSGGNSLTQESAKNRDDDSESSLATDRCRPRKRLHRSPQK